MNEEQKQVMKRLLEYICTMCKIDVQSVKSAGIEGAIERSMEDVIRLEYAKEDDQS